jgi:pimeloyl-ACP methyl ester carboxylesterase
LSPADQRQEIALPAGTVRFREAGEGPPLVFVHGFLVDSRLWDGVVDRLGDRFRCLAPDWPLGAHEVAMRPDADLSPYGMAALIESFLEALEIEDATVVGNDSGGAISQVLVTRHPGRVGRLILTNCDTHDNFPPGAFKALPLIARLPAATTALTAPLGLGAIARAAYRPFARTPIPAELVSSWVRSVRSDPDVRRDLKKFTVGMNKRYTLEAAERLRGSELPMLLAWAPGDRFFPLSYAERLAAEAANAQIVPIADSKTFVPLDQPRALAEEIAGFMESQAAPG